MKRLWFIFLTAIVIFSIARSRKCNAADFAYIANFANDAVSVIRVSDMELIDTIGVGIDPIGVAISPDGKHVYVTNRGSGTVSVIDTANENSVTPVYVGDAPIGIALSPDGHFIYVANRDDDTLSVIDTDDYSVVIDIVVERAPIGVAVSPDGRFVYVANRDDDTVSVINTNDYSLSPVVVGNAPFSVVVSPDGGRVYVTNRDDGTASVIDTDDYSVIDVVVGNRPHGAAVSPDGVYLYIANRGDNTVSVIDTSVIGTDDDPVVDVVTVGNKPFGVALTPDGHQVYITNTGTGSANGTVSVIHTSDFSLKTIVITGDSVPTSFGQFIANMAPEAPADLIATPASHMQIDLSWTDNSSDESGFIIERKTESGGDFSQIAEVGDDEVSYKDSQVSDATTYFYRVCAFNSDGQSNCSNEDSATTYLAAPSRLSATAVSSSQIDLSWTDNSSAELGFKIERKTVSETTTDSSTIESAGTYEQTGTVDANVTSYSDSDLEPYTTYSYRVTAYNDDGNSDYSNEADAQTSDKCFIATAAYGSLLEPHVATLRSFRDVYLLSFAPGRLFVKTYYAYSPPAACFIAKHETLRAAVRIGLLPLVAFSYSILHLGLTLTLILIVSSIMLPVCLFWFRQKKKT